MVEVSVVLPSKDEEETIGICIKKIKQVFVDHGIDGEIIVADNSQDKTPDIAKYLGAKLITPDRNGYGYAYRTAFSKAEGRYIVMGDADDTYDFMEIPRLLMPVMKGEADMVMGCRLNGKMEKGAMPWHHRWIGNPLLTWFLNLFYKAGVSDSHSGFRVISREALDKLDLSSDGMEFASEMIIEAVEKGLRIKEVPSSYSKRKNANSKLCSFSDGWRHLRFMLLNTPNYLFIYPGLLFLFIGIVSLIFVMLNLNLGFMPRSWFVVAGNLLALTGFEIIFFGFFSNIYRGKKLPEYFTLEKGASVGVLTFVVGFIYLLILVPEWMYGGTIPSLGHAMIGFTALILGIQIFFSSFLLSVVAQGRER